MCQYFLSDDTLWNCIVPLLSASEQIGNNSLGLIYATASCFCLSLFLFSHTGYPTLASPCNQCLIYRRNAFIAKPIYLLWQLCQLIVAINHCFSRHVLGSLFTFLVQFQFLFHISAIFLMNLNNIHMASTEIMFMLFLM